MSALDSSEENLEIVEESLSDFAINTILHNGYDVNTLKLIQRVEIEALLPPPHLSDRTKLIEGLNEWRISLGLNPLNFNRQGCSVCGDNILAEQNRQPSISTFGGKKRHEWSAASLIERSSRGRNIIKEYNEKRALTKRDRVFVTHLVIDEFVSEYGKLSKAELRSRASELKLIFPAVDQNISSGV
ncbi:uncharacterized protein LOC129737750 [Uranotaenia lowii]|uniref:uncharacterized protein LOC129737750 n=1 Tax=Uranotaenia lowii TaxID=190385 RepID=UPI0024790124|nr:uncharacterized protein LOC129737750 [Uranotaenia lowii]